MALKAAASATMAETSPTASETPNTSAGHLSVHFEEQHPAEVPFLFEQQRQRIGPSLGVALLYHVAFVVFIIFALRAGSASTTGTEAMLPEVTRTDMVWLTQPGPGGGGGGGGNQMKEPPRKAEMPGKDKITVPVSKPPALEVPRQPKVEPDPVELLNIPAKTLADATASLPGTIEAPPMLPTTSQGSGRGGGAGTGTGS